MSRGVRLERLFYELRAEYEGMAGDLKGAESQLNRFTKFVERNPLAAAGALGAALVGVGIKATQMAAEVEKSLHRIERVVPGAVGQLAQLREAIEETSRSSPRTQAELAQAADAIAKGGVESIDALQQRLVAGARAADASGGDLVGTLSGLDQALDLFGASSADSEAMLAKLFATSKGRVPMEELFATLQAAAPTIRDLDLDFDTAARALGALLEEGKTAKQAGTILKEYGQLGAEGAVEIRRLADSHVIAKDALEDYNAAVLRSRDTMEASWQIAKNHFSSAMIELGQTILPSATKAVGFLVDGLKDVEGILANIMPATRAAYVNHQGTLTDRIAAEMLGLDRLRAGLANAPADSNAHRRLTDAANASQQRIDALKAERAVIEGYIAAFDEMERRRRQPATGAAAGAATTGTPTGTRRRTPEQIKADREALAAAQKAEADAWAEHERERERVAADRTAQAEMDRVVVDDWSKAYRRLKEDAIAFKQAQLELNAALESKEQARVEEEIKKADGKHSNATVELVASISQAVSGAIALASAFGEVDQQTAAALQNVIQIADGVTTILKAGKGDLGSILQIAGNLAQLAQTGFRGGKSDAEKAQADENAASLRAIDRLAVALGDLVGAGISGGLFGRIRAANAQFVEQFLTDRPGRVRRGAAGNADDFFESLGIPFADVQRLADALGVTLNGTAESFRALDRAIAAADFAAFVDSFVGQLDLLHDRFQVYGTTDPTKKFQAVLAALMDPDTGAPAIFAALSAIDLSTSEGQAQAKAILQGIFEQGAAGGFSTDLGGLNPEQLIDVVMELLGYLGVPGAAAGGAGSSLGVVSGFRGLTEAAGNRLADYVREGVNVERQILAAILALRQPILTPPALGGATSAIAGAGVSVTVQFTQNNYGVSDPVSVGRAASEGLQQGLEAALSYTGLVRARRATGNLKAVT